MVGRESHLMFVTELRSAQRQDFTISLEVSLAKPATGSFGIKRQEMCAKNFICYRRSLFMVYWPREYEFPGIPDTITVEAEVSIQSAVFFLFL